MLYDRILRAELMNSDRWLDLHSDSARLAFLCLLPLADDFGNFEGGNRRLFRWLQARTQVKSEADAIKIISDLMDADLIRPYKTDAGDFWHIPRFQSERTYMCRRVPQSPWDDPEIMRRAKHYREYHAARRLENKEKLAKSESNQTLARVESDSNQSLGVGVGVGVGVEEKKDRAKSAIDLVGFDRFWQAYPRKTSKQASVKAWIALHPNEALQAQIIAAIAQHKKSMQWADPKYIPHPSTWLNGKRWEDELPPAQTSGTEAMRKLGLSF
jgi:hypothetical protein